MLAKLNLPKIILVDAEVEHNVYTYSRRSVMTSGKAVLLSTYGTIWQNGLMLTWISRTWSRLVFKGKDSTNEIGAPNVANHTNTVSCCSEVSFSAWLLINGSEKKGH
jgi:hypothetical protein